MPVPESSVGATTGGFSSAVTTGSRSSVRGIGASAGSGGGATAVCGAGSVGGMVCVRPDCGGVKRKLYQCQYQNDAGPEGEVRTVRVAGQRMSRTHDAPPFSLPYGRHEAAALDAGKLDGPGLVAARVEAAFFRSRRRKL